ncbi:M18 family aminopeptidase [Blastococcus sp. TML/C7B]|uniref:M18 family aminopeptidase n=1 Tax=Blastococcus sp. TML/C7B TaxID=2798728 RepID=UPI00190C3513|nr:M18 family aminopeptidase [Blastococcus sp. TML/C7B]MBN1095561.1 M18 family aminopeptidase [Blastococcus sp. TML/C7B]
MPTPDAPTPDSAARDELALGDDLRAFVDVSPSPGHAVAELARRLTAAGFTELAEAERWRVSAGGRHFVVRAGSLIAFRLGSGALGDTGMRLVGAHTDSPTFKVRPHADVRQAGYRLVGVEPYGGGLWHTWLDRELTVAGRVVLRGGGTELVRLPGAPLRFPSLAIHLDRSVREGLTLDPQRHLVPVWDGDLGEEPGLLEAVAAAAGATPGDVVGHDLVLADTQPAARAGADGSWIAAPRLDNLTSCHAGLLALLAAPAGERTQLLVCNDHEEVGSGSMAGARGSFLEDVVRRLATATDPGDAEAVHRAIARSVLVSADMAHGVHPTRAERHEPAHQPRLGGGPVVKLNANQAYATDAATGGWFRERCAEAGVPSQSFVMRADLPCGSTIGPLTATRLGIATVDVGMAQLAMHSCREVASALDVPLMVDALTACLAD